MNISSLHTVTYRNTNIIKRVTVFSDRILKASRARVAKYLPKCAHIWALFPLFRLALGLNVYSFFQVYTFSDAFCTGRGVLGRWCSSPPLPFLYIWSLPYKPLKTRLTVPVLPGGTI